MQITIDITEEDIKNGQGYEGEYDKCPVCHALKRLDCKNLNVDADRIIFTLKNFKYTYKTPIMLSVFIDDFDNYQEIKPSTFIIENPIEKILANDKD